MQKQDSLGDIIVLLLIMTIGAAEAAHLCGVFLHRSVSGCTLIFGILAVGAYVGLFALKALLRRRNPAPPAFGESRRSLSAREKLLLFFFAVLVVSQVLFMTVGKNVSVRGDMTVETVASFLHDNAVYQTNPLTGQAYEQGLPVRMKILCLPTLYAALSNIFHIRYDGLILYVFPIITLFCCYGAYGCLAKSLFPKNRDRGLLFMTLTALLVWVGGYGAGMDGFGLLFAGWQGVTIRGAVLVPYTLSLCIRKKYVYLPLCILAEMCITWTLYGFGICLAAMAGMLLISFLRRRLGAAKEAEDGGAV